MTEDGNFVKNAKCKHGHQSAMSISAWCDLKRNYTVLKLHNMAIILSVFVRGKSHLLLNNTCLKAMVLKYNEKNIHGISNSLK